MTKEQALAILKQPDRIGCNWIKATDEESNKYNQESIEALNMAIKALEQQPSDDCVSRAEVFEITINEDNISRTMDRIKALPPVTPVFPKGATNGDMIKAMFTGIVVIERTHFVNVYLSDRNFWMAKLWTSFELDWWNAPYKGGEE